LTAFHGEIAALTTAVCWSFTAVFFSYGGRRVGSLIVNRSRLLFALVLLLATHLALRGTLLPLGAEPFRWGWLGLSSVLGLVIGDAALFQAFVLIGPRLSMLMMSLVPILGTGLAWLILGETVTGRELVGIMLALGGVSWVVTERRDGRSASEVRDYRRGILMGLIGAFGQATNLITAKFGLVDGFSTMSATLIRILVAVVVLWALTALQGQIGATLAGWRNRRALVAIVGGTVVGPFLGIWLSLVAIQNTRVGIASTLMALPPVLLIPIEYVLHGQRVSARGVTGTLLAFAGVALIFLGR